MNTEVKYWKDLSAKLMIKQLSPTEVVKLQIQGRDPSQSFNHIHCRVIYPSAERLAEDLEKLQEGCADEWEDLLTEFIQVNKEKAKFMNDHRQKLFDQGKPLR